MMYSLFTSIFLGGVYFSDRRGAIEPEKSGFFDIVSLICSRIAMMGIVFIEIVMFYEVVSRYVFARPTLWANELSLWIASFLFLLAGLYAMQNEAISVSLSFTRCSQDGQKRRQILSLSC